MTDGIAARLDDFGGGYSSCPGSTATPTPPGGMLRVVVGPSESATGAETPTPTSTPMPWTVTPTPTFEPMATPTSVAHRAGKVLAKPAQQGVPPSVCAKYGITSQDCTATTYYNFGSQRVAMRVQSDVRNDVYWLHGDHLGSASLTTDASGGKVAEMRFKPWREVRTTSGLSCALQRMA